MLADSSANKFDHKSLQIGRIDGDDGAYSANLPPHGLLQPQAQAASAVERMPAEAPLQAIPRWTAASAYTRFVLRNTDGFIFVSCVNTLHM